MNKKIPPKVIMCCKCSSLLWELTILSYDGEDPLSTQWKSMSAGVPSKAPKENKCPLCHKGFMEVHESGHPIMTLADPETGEKIKTWI